MTETPQTVTYFAVSLFSSKTFWVNIIAFLIAISGLSEVVTIVPLRFMPMYSAVVAILNVYLRTVTVRPVALIAPGDTAPVDVPKIGPPPPPPLSD